MLSDEAVEAYCRHGVAGPFELETSRAEFEATRAHCDELLETAGPWSRGDLPPVLVEGHEHGASVVDRHVDCARVADVARDPAVVERVAAVYGRDTILYFSQFVDKPPGGGRIEWHDDCGFHDLHPACWATVWVAFDPVTVDNGCLEFLPGSNDARTEHVRSDEDDQWFPKRAAASRVDERRRDTRRVRFEMEPGEFLLFDNRVLHRSGRNTTADRRRGLQLRVTKPFTRPTDPKRPRPRSVVVGGENPHAVHDCDPVPAECTH